MKKKSVIEIMTKLLNLKSKSVFNIFINSNNNKVDQSENFYKVSDKEIEIILNLLRRDWNNGYYKTVFQNLEINKEIYSTPLGLLFEVELLYYNDEVNEAKEVFKYLEENYKSKIEKNPLYHKLNYFLNNNTESLDILKYEHKFDKEEIIIARLYNEKNYQEIINYNNKSDKIEYLIASFILETEIDLKKNLLEKIISKIESLNLNEKFKYLIDIIEVLILSNNLSLKLNYLGILEFYIEIFEKEFKHKEIIDKNICKKIINLYLDIKGYFISKYKFKSLLKEYSQYLDEINKIRLSLLNNSGFKNLIDSYYNNKGIKEIEFIFFILFLDNKYKYIIQLFRKYKLEQSKEISLINIFSKILLKKNISENEVKILQENLQSKYGFFFYQISLFYKGKKTLDKLKEELIVLIEENIDDEILNLVIVKGIYDIDKLWIVNYYLDREEIYFYLIPEIVNLITNDSQLYGHVFMSLVEKIENIAIEHNLKLNYEQLGQTCIEYKNKQLGLKFLCKAWENFPSKNLAKQIRDIILILENLEYYEYNYEKIYKYLEDEQNNIEIVKNIIFLKLLDYKKGIIKLNKFLLKIEKRDIQKLYPLLQMIYFKTLTQSNNREIEDNLFENSIIIDNQIKKIPNTYQEIKNYEKFSKEEFRLYKIEKNSDIKRLDLFLLAQILEKYIQFKKRITGIREIQMSKDATGEEIIKKLRKASGFEEMDKQQNKYINGESKRTLLFFLYSNFYNLNILMDKLLNNFNKNLLRVPKNQINMERKKLLSLESILFLFKLEILEYIVEDKTIYLQQSTLDFFNKNIVYPEEIEIMKVLVKIKDRIIDDTKAVEVEKNYQLETSKLNVSPLSCLYFSLMALDGDYITEDINFNIGTSYSSLFLIDHWSRKFGINLAEKKELKKVLIRLSSDIAKEEKLL